jgi:hypothetical protein
MILEDDIRRNGPLGVVGHGRCSYAIDSTWYFEDKGGTFYVKVKTTSWAFVTTSEEYHKQYIHKDVAGRISDVGPALPMAKSEYDALMEEGRKRWGYMQFSPSLDNLLNGEIWQFVPGTEQKSLPKTYIDPLTGMRYLDKGLRIPDGPGA